MNSLQDCSPLNPVASVNVACIESLFEDSPIVVPSNAVQRTIKNLQYFHQEQVLPINVYIKLHTDHKNRSYTTQQLCLFKLFSSGILYQIRPFTLKVISGHGPIFLGAVFLFPYFEKSNIVSRSDGSIDEEKSNIVFCICKGSQILHLLCQNVTKIMNTSTNNANLPRKNCKGYLDVCVTEDTTLRSLLTSKATKNSAEPTTRGQTFLEQPWMQLDKLSIRNVIKKNPKVRTMPSFLKFFWPLNKIQHPVTDSFWLIPTDANDVNSKSEKVLTAFRVASATPTFSIASGLFSFDERTCTSTSDSSESSNTLRIPTVSSPPVPPEPPVVSPAKAKRVYKRAPKKQTDYHPEPKKTDNTEISEICEKTDKTTSIAKPFARVEKEFSEF